MTQIPPSTFSTKRILIPKLLTFSGSGITTFNLAVSFSFKGSNYAFYSEPITVNNGLLSTNRIYITKNHGSSECILGIGRNPDSKTLKQGFEVECSRV